MLTSLLAGSFLAGCGMVTIDTGSASTSAAATGSGGATSTPVGGAGPGGGGGGTTGSGQGGGAQEIEQVAAFLYPLRLRLNATAAFVMTTDNGALFFRIDKATGAVTSVSEEPSGGLDYVVDDETLFYSESSSFCYQCPPGPGMVSSVPVTGGSPTPFASDGPWLPSRLALAADGLYANNDASGQLLHLPFTGGEPEIALDFGVGANELARDGSRIYFTGKLDGAVRFYDELTQEVVVLAPAESGLRSLIARDGAAYWLAGKEPTELRRAKDGQVETLMVSPSEGVDLAVSSSHAFLVTSPSLNAMKYPHGELWAVPLAGGPPQVLVDDIEKATDVEVDDTHVYWLTEGDADVDGAVWRIPVPG